MIVSTLGASRFFYACAVNVCQEILLFLDFQARIYVNSMFLGTILHTLNRSLGHIMYTFHLRLLTWSICSKLVCRSFCAPLSLGKLYTECILMKRFDAIQLILGNVQFLTKLAPNDMFNDIFDCSFLKQAIYLKILQDNTVNYDGAFVLN